MKATQSPEFEHQEPQKKKKSEKIGRFIVNHLPPCALVVSANLNVPPIVRSSLTREDTVTLPESSHGSDASSAQFPFPGGGGATLIMANSPPDFEFARPLWLLKPGVTTLRSGAKLRLPWVNMLGSSGCMSCALPTDFLRLRVIRDIMATWGKEVVLVGGLHKKLGNLQLGW
jgi:hypothetical protein